MNIEVKPGFSEESVLTFPSLGNEAYAHRPSSLVVKFKQAGHSNYKRNKNDLIYVHKISLEHALISEPIQIVILLFINLLECT
jgi:DnaJ-class molecular chaperone